MWCDEKELVRTCYLPDSHHSLSFLLCRRSQIRTPCPDYHHDKCLPLIDSLSDRTVPDPLVLETKSVQLKVGESRREVGKRQRCPVSYYPHFHSRPDHPVSLRPVNKRQMSWRKGVVYVDTRRVTGKYFPPHYRCRGLYVVYNLLFSFRSNRFVENKRKF